MRLVCIVRIAGVVDNMANKHVLIDTLAAPIVPRDSIAPLMLQVIATGTGKAPMFEGGIASQGAAKAYHYVRIEELPQGLQESIRTYISAVTNP
jgi:hypothetical protein